MPGVVDGNGPNYISAHSADVILSDIRPIKLKPEALAAINVLLDEFLHNILTTSRSLATEKLRSSLLGILPTSLGKEALLEAEVELRAYWERTDLKVPSEDDSRAFHLQWSFELLRLKCSAYSTLNEEDEDPAAEARVNEVFSKAHPHAPKAAFLDPAALYLTAIIESMCEHILSNVGRVAARDSSRTYATVSDLFVALCEDDSIFGLFRMMKVYEQIETMSKAPKVRRSKSITRYNERPSISRDSPQDLALASTPSRSRQSSEGHSTLISSPIGVSRTSIDKTRAKEAQKGHRKTDSLKSELSRQLEEEPVENAEMLREFDDLMRSASTMKMSLTPDRLKTMEVYKQEKDQKAGRRPDSHFPSASLPDALPPAARRPPPRNVGPIDENDERKPTGRPRQASVATQPTATSPVPTRTRSISTTEGPAGTVLTKPVRSPSVKATASSPVPNTPPPDMAQGRVMANKFPQEKAGFPQRTRTKARNRESLDLDDIMNGSDEEAEVAAPPPRGNPVQTSPMVRPTSPPRRVNPPKVSASTRELMDFLAEGPPEAQASLSKAGRELVDFLADGPPDYGSSTVSLEKSQSQSKGTGRLQRMISKLNIGNAEKARGSSDGPKTPGLRQPNTPIRGTTLNPKPSTSTLASLANRPIPPRPPRPPSPPSSIPSHDSSDENKTTSSPTPNRRPYPETITPERAAAERSKMPPPPVPSYATPAKELPQSPDRGQPIRGPPSAFGHTNGHVNGNAKPIPVPIRTTSHPSLRKQPPPVATAAPAFTEPDVRDMQRLLLNATTADECRLILDMFMARNGIPREPKPQDVPYPSPSPSIVKHTPYSGSETSLETSLVELLLNGSPQSSEAVSEAPSSQVVVPEGQGQQPSPVEGLPVESNIKKQVPLGLQSQNSHVSQHRHQTISPGSGQPLVSIRA